MKDEKEVTNMLFQAPDLDPSELAVVEQIENLKQSLRRQLYEPRRWFGSLRRLSLARAVQASNSIEGFHARLDDVAAVNDREEPLDTNLETQMALIGYREAMTYVLQLSQEEDQIEYSDQLLKSLHFMMTSYDLDNRPGRWRAGPIYVNREDTGEIVYEGPPVEMVPGLMSALVAGLNEPNDSPPMVRAGMAHLNLVMVHPFRDGNGRMARCLQTLILASEGVLAPQFCSIEEYLGDTTPAYYKVLGDVGQGAWHPERDARPWVRYVLLAHLSQARLLQLRVRESEALWSELEKLIKSRGLPERSIPLLYDAAHRLKVRNAIYRTLLEDVSAEEISEAAAGRDLKLAVDRGLLSAHGEKRGRFYTATSELEAVWDTIKAKRPEPPSVEVLFSEPPPKQLAL
jgi:Fic family protein